MPETTCDRIVEVLRDRSIWSHVFKEYEDYLRKIGSPYGVFKCLVKADGVIVVTISVPRGIDTLISASDVWMEYTGEVFEYSILVCSENKSCIAWMEKLKSHLQKMTMEDEVNKLLKRAGIPYRVMDIHAENEKVRVILYPKH